MKQTNKIRRYLSQFVATTIKNFLLFGMGLCYALPTVMIPILTGIQNEHNQNETMQITYEQASWIGALGYLVQPIGSILSAMITDPLGRKRSMMLINIPFAIGWYVLYQASAVWQIFVGMGFHGLAIGLMEAPVATYIGEICEPSVRSIFMGYTFISGTVGMFTVYQLNILMSWRTISLVCMTVPVCSLIAIIFIPESPQWLLSKNQTEEAEKSLRWLRGWSSSESVAEEFIDLKKHSERSKSCNICIKNYMKCSHPLPTMRDKLAELKRKRTLKSFFIVISMFVITQFSGIYSMRPFMVHILKAYNTPIPPEQALMIMSVLSNISYVIFMLSVHFTGKRKLYLFSLSGVVASAASISWIGLTYLPSGYVSFGQAHNEPFHWENKSLSYIPIVCLLAWTFFTELGINQIPWMVLSEIFPFKCRGIACGFAAAINYALAFISKKNYYNLEMMLSLLDVSLLFTFISIIGLILMYNILPETENRSLEDIELHFSDNSKRITDRKIVISNQKCYI